MTTSENAQYEYNPEETEDHGDNAAEYPVQQMSGMSTFQELKHQKDRVEIPDEFLSDQTYIGGTTWKKMKGRAMQEDCK